MHCFLLRYLYGCQQRETHLGLHVKLAIFLYDFNHWIFSTVLKIKFPVNANSGWRADTCRERKGRRADMEKLNRRFPNYANGNRISSPGLLNASCSRAACRVGHRVLRRAGEPSANGGGSARVEPTALHEALHTTSQWDQSVRGSLWRGQGLLPGP